MGNPGGGGAVIAVVVGDEVMGLAGGVIGDLEAHAGHGVLSIPVHLAQLEVTPDDAVGDGVVKVGQIHDYAIFHDVKRLGGNAVRGVTGGRSGLAHFIVTVGE